MKNTLLLGIWVFLNFAPGLGCSTPQDTGFGKAQALYADYKDFDLIGLYASTSIRLRGEDSYIIGIPPNGARFSYALDNGSGELALLNEQAVRRNAGNVYNWDDPNLLATVENKARSLIQEFDKMSVLMIDGIAPGDSLLVIYVTPEDVLITGFDYSTFVPSDLRKRAEWFELLDSNWLYYKAVNRLD